MSNKDSKSEQYPIMGNPNGKLNVRYYWVLHENLHPVIFVERVKLAAREDPKDLRLYVTESLIEFLCDDAAQHFLDGARTAVVHMNKGN